MSKLYSSSTFVTHQKRKKKKNRKAKSSTGSWKGIYHLYVADLPTFKKNKRLLIHANMIFTCSPDDPIARVGKSLVLLRCVHVGHVGIWEQHGWQKISWFAF